MYIRVSEQCHSFCIFFVAYSLHIKESIWNTLDIHSWPTGHTTGDTSCPIRNGVPGCLSAQVMQIHHKSLIGHSSG